MAICALILDENITLPSVFKKTINRNICQKKREKKSAEKAYGKNRSKIFLTFSSANLKTLDVIIYKNVRYYPVPKLLH